MSKKYRYKDHTWRKYLSDQSWTSPERVEALLSLIKLERTDNTNNPEINQPNPERR